MSKTKSYENNNPEVEDCLNTLVRLLARLVAKEQVEKQKSLNIGSDNKMRD